MHLYLTKKRTKKVVRQSVRQLMACLIGFARNEFEKMYFLR